nr:MAG TPA: hypothetical protein [Caudoviricetes sp.]
MRCGALNKHKSTATYTRPTAEVPRPCGLR